MWTAFILRQFRNGNLKLAMKSSRSVVFKFIVSGVLLIHCSSIVNVNGEATLKGVAMLFRHGDRSPLRSYPLDPHRNHKWFGGFGALSGKGARHMYESGALKSLRYFTLLDLICEMPPCDKIASKVLVQSSRVTRCVASARFFLMGLLGNKMSEDIIDVLSAAEDEMLAGDGKPCPKYDNLVDVGPALNDSSYAQVIDLESEEGREFIGYLENNTGLVLNTTFELMKLTDTLLIQSKNKKLTLPSWTVSVFKRYLKPLMAIFFDLWNNSPLVKIRSRALLKDIMTRLGNFEQGSSSQNVLIYSAHDVTIGGMLHLLEIRNQTVSRSAYGASLNMELYENSHVSGDYEIRIFYFKNYADEHPMQVIIPNCEAPCPLRKFIESVESKFLLNYEEECSK